MQTLSAPSSPHRTQSVGEEIANSITHGFGALFSVAVLVLLIVAAARRGTARHVVSCAIFGASLVVLYASSALYHALTAPRAKHVFQILDHASIYILIAGTYTPFTLVSLHGVWGWSLFAFAWSLAAAGIVFKSFGAARRPVLSTAIYILMGWCAVIAFRPLLAALDWQGFVWLFAGGLCYTSGVVFYALRRPYMHAVWHLFVLAGSLCHFAAIYWYVIPRGD
jgi:hemolysin III